MIERVEHRATLSQGRSSDEIYRAVARACSRQCSPGGLVLDVGCGRGNLWSWLRDYFDRYIGVDVVRYDGFPSDGEFVELDVDSGQVVLPDALADVVCAVETIEHVENPRRFVRDIARWCRPGGVIVVSTPNQLSLLSKLTLVLRNEFSAFRDGSYPAHLSALLEVDLRRIAAECDLAVIEVVYTESGRIPGTARHYPRWLSGWWPRAFSDNVVVIARKPR